MALVLYGSDNNGWSPSTSWYASHMGANMNNGISVPKKGTSLYNWLLDYCRIRVVTDQSNYASIRKPSGKEPADGAILFCPSADLREDCGPWIWRYWWDVSGNWQELAAAEYQDRYYKYMRYSYLLMGLGLAGHEDWPVPGGLETIQTWGTTRLSLMDGKGYPIAIFHERLYAEGTDRYNSHRGEGVNICDQRGSVQWNKAWDFRPFGYYGGWASHKYWIPSFWGATSPGGYSGPNYPNGGANMNRAYGYKQDGN